jgi:hypothetical protein
MGIGLQSRSPALLAKTQAADTGGNQTMRKRAYTAHSHVAIIAFLFCTALALGQIGCSLDDCTRCSDVDPPRVESTYPAEGDTNIAVDTTVTATFSELMNPMTISAGSFTLEGPGGPVTATVSFDGLTATLTPLVQLAGHSVYTARIDEGVTDMTGNRMEVPYAWSFTTDVAPLIIYPDIEFTVRDENGDDAPDILVGGGPPGRFLQAGVVGLQADRAVIEFPLGEIVHDEVLQALIFLNISDNTDPDAAAHVEAWGFSGNGTGELSDWNEGSRVFMHDYDELRAGETHAFPMTDAINQALLDGATHIGFRMVVTGDLVIQIATSDGASGLQGARIILVY